MDDKKIVLTLCFSLILISFKLCADPINSNFFFMLKRKTFNSLLKDGKYTPSKSSLIASFKLFDK